MKINLNLIPPNKKEEIINNQRLKLIFSVEITLTIMIVIFFIMLLSFKYILNFNEDHYKVSQKNNRNIVQLNKLEKYDTQFKQINSQVSCIILINKNQLYWSRLLKRLSELVFSGIKLNSLTTRNYKIVLRGVASNREKLIAFKKRLESESELMNINLPLSDLVDKNNIEFQISFNVQKDYLKNK